MFKFLISLFSCRFKEFVGPVNTLLTKGCSQNGNFRHLSIRLFRGQQYWKYLCCEARLFFKMFENFQKKNENLRKDLWFLRKLHLNWLP